ncbi:MAG: N-acetylornithine carbamoyltransferase [Bacteroidota bacterium]
MNHFTSVNDVPDLSALLARCRSVKQNPLGTLNLGVGKTLGCIFFNPSLRTRLSTQRAAYNLGLSVIVMNIGAEGWKLEFEDGTVMNDDKAEHIKDAVAVMGQYCDVLGIRAFANLKDRDADYQEAILKAFKQYSGVPIISLESATRHPCQSLADLITIEQHKPSQVPTVLLTWAPHPKALPQAVGNSFAEWTLAAGYNLRIANPAGYDLNPEFTRGAEIFHDAKSAYEGVDFVYAKNWSSYQSYGEVLNQEMEWRVDEQKMALTENAGFMHCLPVRRNMVVTDAVIDSERSLVVEQAANRVVAAQAVLEAILR